MTYNLHHEYKLKLEKQKVKWARNIRYEIFHLHHELTPKLVVTQSIYPKYENQ